MRFDEKKYLEDVAELDWTDVLSCDDLDEATENCTRKLRYVLNAPWIIFRQREFFVLVQVCQEVWDLVLVLHTDHAAPADKLELGVHVLMGGECGHHVSDFLLGTFRDLVSFSMKSYVNCDLVYTTLQFVLLVLGLEAVLVLGGDCHLVPDVGDIVKLRVISHVHHQTLETNLR